VNDFDEYRRVESGRPEQALIEAEIARIVDDLTVRVQPDPGDAVTIEFFCNVKSRKEVAREDAWFERTYPDSAPARTEEYDGNTWKVHLNNGYGFGSFDVPGGASDTAWRVELIADHAQDLAMDATWVARPRCPPHPHPMVLRVDDDDDEGDDGVRWACPKSAIRCAIGGYRAFATQAGLTIVDG
jgi:hypothetical protein